MILRIGLDEEGRSRVYFHLYDSAGQSVADSGEIVCYPDGLRVESTEGELLLDLPTDLDGNVRYCLYNQCGELLGRSDGTHTTVGPCLRMESWPRAGQARGAPHQTPQP